MKSMLFAAALLAGTAAIAQDTAAPAQDAQPAATEQEAPPPAPPMQEAPATQMPMQSSTQMPMQQSGTGQTVAAGNTAPERDSRGVAVVSDPAMAPAGTNQAPAPGEGRAVPNPNQDAAFATQPSTGEKPPCSRTVTDNCTQTYEVGRRRGPRR